MVIQGSFNIGISGIFLQHFTDVKTNIAIVDGANVLFSIDGPDIKKTTDFTQNQQFSIVKNFNITIPQSTVSNIITTYPNAKLIIRYKIAYNSNSSILPNVNASGWLPKILGTSAPEYFIHETQYSFLDNRPRATITGPNSIQTEGNYIVSNAASFNVVPNGYNNSIDATLTNLGSGHYIVKANQGFIGDLYLSAVHYDGLITAKKVTVTGPPLSITGEDTICLESIYEVTGSPISVTLINSSGIATLTTLGNNQYKVTRVGNASGSVVLRAVDASGLVVNKLITVAPPVPTVQSISGISILGIGEYTYSLLDPHLYNSLQWSVQSGTNNVTFTNNSLSSGKFKVNSWNSNGYNLIILTVKGFTTCGTPFIISRQFGSGGNGGIIEDQ